MREAIYIQFPADESLAPVTKWCTVDEAKQLWKAANANAPAGIEFIEVWSSDRGVIKRKCLTSGGKSGAPGRTFSEGSKALGAQAKADSDDSRPPTGHSGTLFKPEPVAAKVADPNDAGAVELSQEEKLELAGDAAGQAETETNLPAEETNPQVSETIPGSGTGATSLAVAEEVSETPAAEPTPAPVVPAAQPKSKAEKRAAAKAAKAAKKQK